ncbi:hypothetical protein Sste5346_008638 [Sporothrix stenoceras]|uniref:Tyrosine specific protein phosphatases domain-containing protein n=1 Tax=Sporothrix stenoceras TaxID=5173 RepID=A0ABR3YNH1_9PEZI
MRADRSVQGSDNHRRQEWPTAPSTVLGLSSAEMHQITGGCEHTESKGIVDLWTYEMRREAQQVLPFLYLGPANAARDTAFLQRTGITKVVAVRESRLADARLLVVEHVAKKLGIVSECIDVAGWGDLLRALPASVQSINQHMLHDVPTDSDGISTGKVLVFCETGNVRAPPVVAAYLMSMYGLELVDTLRFLNKRRFCMSLDEEAKHMLLSFGDLLHARSDVAEQAMTDSMDTFDGRGERDDDQMHDDDTPDIQKSVEDASVGFGGNDSRQSRAQMNARSSLLAVPSPRDERSRSRPAKRGVEETMDDEDDRIEGASLHAPSREPSAEPGRPNLDRARYEDRAHFVPFTDTGMD